VKWFIDLEEKVRVAAALDLLWLHYGLRPRPADPNARGYR
jgi:hypothetical protein